MNNAERLRHARNLLLRLHKTLVDHERAIYEGIYGRTTSGHFLNILLEDRDFAWLRKFSTLIAEIDEMFDQKDEISDESIDMHIGKLRNLIEMNDEDEEFLAKYKAALQQDIDAARQQGELRELIS